MGREQGYVLRHAFLDHGSLYGAGRRAAYDDVEELSIGVVDLGAGGTARRAVREDSFSKLSGRAYVESVVSGSASDVDTRAIRGVGAGEGSLGDEVDVGDGGRQTISLWAAQAVQDVLAGALEERGQFF